MATILEFPASSTRGQSGTAHSGAAAEVVMFPGVVYQRYEDQPAATTEPAKQKKRPTRRDRLELED